jgi:hypothetical protein
MLDTRALALPFRAGSAAPSAPTVGKGERRLRILPLRSRHAPTTHEPRAVARNLRDSAADLIGQISTIATPSTRSDRGRRRLGRSS